MTIYDSIIRKEPVEKGWSGDQKYCAATEDGRKYLLRISPIGRLEQRKRNFTRMQHWAALGIPMCLPVEFGTCEAGCYSIQSWIEGADAEEYIPTLPLRQQYIYGLDAGQIARRMHTLPVPADVSGWADRYGQKIDRKLEMYQACPLKYDKEELFLAFLAQNRHLIKNRPQCFQHGDYHIGNMMVDTAGQLVIIDFEKEDYGDPWEEFNRIVWCAQASPAFASGLVDGYFDGSVPMDFWKLLALYISTNTLSSLPWAIPFGDTEIHTMQNQANQVLAWYSDMQNPVPAWYVKQKSR